jgi:hypothetical protein
MATISFDFSATLTCPSTSRWRAAKAETIWIGARFRHWEITGWYMRESKKFGGQSPREFLRGKDWTERTRIGLEALITHGVLKP